MPCNTVESCSVISSTEVARCLADRSSSNRQCGSKDWLLLLPMLPAAAAALLRKGEVACRGRLEGLAKGETPGLLVTHPRGWLSCHRIESSTSLEVR